MLIQVHLEDLHLTPQSVIDTKGMMPEFQTPPLDETLALTI